NPAGLADDLRDLVLQEQASVRSSERGCVAGCCRPEGKSRNEDSACMERWVLDRSRALQCGDDSARYTAGFGFLDDSCVRFGPVFYRARARAMWPLQIGPVEGHRSP